MIQWLIHILLHLAFVIHYQRPGSVVHYYQQVGRAGRAVEKAYGILLNGKEDDEIVNYFICVITGSLVYGEWAVKISIVQFSWFPFALFLGFVFVTMFTMVAMTVKTHGIMIATIFQKMSLLFPALSGIVIYNETNSWFKAIGIALALLAIVMMSFPDRKTNFNC